jgi:hypothetical protein
MASDMSGVVVPLQTARDGVTHSAERRFPNNRTNSARPVALFDHSFPCSSRRILSVSSCSPSNSGGNKFRVVRLLVHDAFIL